MSSDREKEDVTPFSFIQNFYQRSEGRNEKRGCLSSRCCNSIFHFRFKERDLNIYLNYKYYEAYSSY